MITPLDQTVRGVMEFTWPMIAICVLSVISIRLMDLLKNKKPFVLYKELLGLLFIIYILCLFQVVTFEDPGGFMGSNNLIPFHEITRYHLGSRLFLKNVLGNLLIFIPYGFFASIYLKLDKKYQAFLLVAFASFCIESTQLAIGRVFDIDDILLNIVGGMIGYFIYRSFERLGQAFPKSVHTTWFLNIITSVLLIALIGYLWMVMNG